MIESLNKNITAVTRCYFGGGKAKAPPPPPRPPERGDAARLTSERNQSFGKQGRASTILSGSEPNLNFEQKKKTLLGG